MSRPLERLDISKLTAKKLNLDVNMVDEIMRGYYAYVSKELTSLNHTTLSVPGLGIFSVRKKKVQEMILKQEKIIDMLDYRTKLSLSRFSTLQEAKYKLEDLQRSLALLEEEEQRKKQFKNGESADQSLEE